MQILLTEEEKINLEKRHRNEDDGKVRDRIKSILLRSEGWSVSKISQALRIHNDTVYRYLTDYAETKKLGALHQGSVEKLSSEQSNDLELHVDENLYTKAHDIAGYVKEKYGIDYTVAGMTDWLKRHNFSYKETKGQPSKSDMERQEFFVMHYTEFKKITPANEPILFIDAVHPTMATKISRGWFRRGEDKLIFTSASRTRLNIVGAIELSTMKVISNSYDTVNGASIISFLDTVKSNYPTAPKFHIILDQSGYHRSYELSEYAEKNKFELHFLPPYSPNLNPIERLWKVMNEWVRNNYFFKSAKEFKMRILDFFENTIPEISESLRSRINDNFHILNAAK